MGIADFGFGIFKKKRNGNRKTRRPLCVVVGPAEKRASVSSFPPVKSLQFQVKVLSFHPVESSRGSREGIVVPICGIVTTARFSAGPTTFLKEGPLSLSVFVLCFRNPKSAFRDSSCFPVRFLAFFSCGGRVSRYNARLDLWRFVRRARRASRWDVLLELVL